MADSLAYCVSWDQLHRDCRALAARLSGLAPFSGMIAVTRGGLIPAGIVARELGIRVIETVSIASYHVEQQQGRLAVLKDLAPAFMSEGGAGLLVVDDLVDTGETARFLRVLLPQAHLAAVYAKPQGRPLLDTFITEVSQDTWIYFPWDLGLSFQAPLAENSDEPGQ